jgi:hypothetical protein
VPSPASGCNPIPLAINPRRYALRREALRLYFHRQYFDCRHRSAMGQTVRLHGEHRLRFGVRLSDEVARCLGERSCEGVAAGYGPHHFYKLHLFQGDRR